LPWDEFQRVLLATTARSSHETLLRTAFEELRRQCNLITRRTVIRGAQHRFFIALLLNVRGRDRILRLVGKSFPAQPPVETVLHWLTELNELPSTERDEPNVLGISFDEGAIAVFRGMLEGKSPTEIVDWLARDFDSDDVRDEEAAIHELCSMLASTPLFRTLFEGEKL
jgi:hypothetical protein